MNLSIIIVNYNSKDYLDACLDSIKNCRIQALHEIIVVDNASYDGCGDLIGRKYPEVIFVQSEKNGGFAYANNLGYSHSKGKSLLFLNPDTEVMGTTIDDLYMLLFADKNAGGIGCMLLNSDHTVQESCIQAFPNIFNQLIDSKVLRRITSGWKIWGNSALMREPDGIPSDVQVVSGACFMVKKEVFIEVGMFSEDYFLYAEDLDICYKIKEAGYRVLYNGKSHVVHHGGGSTTVQSESQFSNILMRESVFRFMIKNKGIAYAYTYRFSVSLASVGRIIVLMVMVPLSYRKNSQRRAKYSINKWIRILKWSMGGERWTREDL